MVRARANTRKEQELRKKSKEYSNKSECVMKVLGRR